MPAETTKPRFVRPRTSIQLHFNNLCVNSPRRDLTQNSHQSPTPLATNGQEDNLRRPSIGSSASPDLPNRHFCIMFTFPFLSCPHYIFDAFTNCLLVSSYPPFVMVWKGKRWRGSRGLGNNPIGGYTSMDAKQRSVISMSHPHYWFV